MLFIQPFPTNFEDIAHERVEFTLTFYIKSKFRIYKSDLFIIFGPSVVIHESHKSSPTKKSKSLNQRQRHLLATEREEQERIDRENRILLRKILEQHHGLRRSSSIPPPQRKSVNINDLKKQQRQIDLSWRASKQTSNQVKDQT